MEKIDPKDITAETNPIFKDLPEHLKDVDKYKELETSFFNILQNGHKHKSPKTYAGCRDCNFLLKKRHDMIMKAGFTSMGQYFSWKKVMDIIYNKRAFQIK